MKNPCEHCERFKGCQRYCTDEKEKYDMHQLWRRKRELEHEQMNKKRGKRVHG